MRERERKILMLSIFRPRGRKCLEMEINGSFALRGRQRKNK
jgi:hypothetical protein